MTDAQISARREAFAPRWLCVLAVAAAAGCSGADRDGGAGIAAAAHLASPAAPGSGQPHLAVAPDGEAVLSWLQPDGEGYALNFSRLRGGDWSEPQIVASGDDFLVNWADFPSVEPITTDVWAAHWLKIAPDSFASYDIALSISNDGGRTWSEGELLNADGVLTEHGFVSLFPWGGDLGAVWLDGRRLAELFETGVVDEDGPPVGVSLRYARIGYDGAVGERGEIDELACDCCQTDAALTAAGPLIVYRDRSPDEIRDIAVRRHEGGAWGPPVALGPDNWRIEGCPVNGPAVASDGEEVVVAWFTAAGSSPSVRFARSRDGGAAFAEPVEIDGDGSFGHVDVVLLGDGSAVVSWWRRRAEGFGIALAMRRVTRDGTLGDVQVVAEHDIAQPLDVPQMVAAGNRLVLAWTDAQQMTVETATVPLPGSASD